MTLDPGQERAVGLPPGARGARSGRGWPWQDHRGAPSPGAPGSDRRVAPSARPWSSRRPKAFVGCASERSCTSAPTCRSGPYDTLRSPSGAPHVPRPAATREGQDHHARHDEAQTRPGRWRAPSPPLPRAPLEPSTTTRTRHPSPRRSAPCAETCSIFSATDRSSRASSSAPDGRIPGHAIAGDARAHARSVPFDRRASVGARPRPPAPGPGGSRHPRRGDPRRGRRIDRRGGLRRSLRHRSRSCDPRGRSSGPTAHVSLPRHRRGPVVCPDRARVARAEPRRRRHARRGRRRRPTPRRRRTLRRMARDDASSRMRRLRTRGTRRELPMPAQGSGVGEASARRRASDPRRGSPRDLLIAAGEIDMAGRNPGTPHREGPESATIAVLFADRPRSRRLPRSFEESSYPFASCGAETSRSRRASTSRRSTRYAAWSSTMWSSQTSSRGMPSATTWSRGARCTWRSRACATHRSLCLRGPSGEHARLRIAVADGR